MSSTAVGPQPSGMEVDNDNDEDDDGDGIVTKKQKVDGAEENDEMPKDNTQSEKAKEKKKRIKDGKMPAKQIKKAGKMPVGEEKKKKRQGRKKKAPNLRCNDCGVSLRRASIVRHFRRVHGFSSDAKWIRAEHPEVVSEEEDNKTYVLDPADMVDFVDPEDPKEKLKRKIESLEFKVELLKDQNHTLQVWKVRKELEEKRLLEELTLLRSENLRLKQLSEERKKEGEESKPKEEEERKPKEGEESEPKEEEDRKPKEEEERKPKEGEESKPKEEEESKKATETAAE